MSDDLGIIEKQMLSYVFLLSLCVCTRIMSWNITGITNIVMNTIKQQDPYRTNIIRDREVLPLLQQGKEKENRKLEK